MLSRLLIALVLLLPMPSVMAEWTPKSIPATEPIPSVENGPVWYRAFLKVGKNLVVPMADPKDLWRESMTLALQDIPGSFQVTLNGVVIIEGKDVGAKVPQRFKVPKDILQENVYNVLAIRLEGPSAARGLTHPPVFGGYLDEVALERDWQWMKGEPKEADFQPQAEKPAIAAYDPTDWREARTVLKAPDEPVRGKQVSPSDALAKLTAADDLIVESLFHEPDVAQPTHVSFDAQGRMWIAQYRQYPYPAGLTMISRDRYYRSKYDKVPPAPPHHDKGADIVSVHEDRDGDGVYDHQKQVLTGLNMANSVLHGHGGIWVMHTPYLLFYPDADGDDIPEGDIEVRLSGFGLEDTHSTANGLTWGPDGWLYGAQGSTVISHVLRPNEDAPGTAPRYLEGCCVWRYHPETKEFEVFADGSGNTFGLHFDAEGRLFSGHNGGNTRGWHHIQSGDYLKQGLSPDKFGPPSNPYAFGQMPNMTATHPVPRFSHNIITVDGSAMPTRWRGTLLGADPLHQNLTASTLTPKASSFETTDIESPLAADDMTFRPVYLTNSPDGSITVADFREEYIAHGQNYQGQIDPGSGRIYRLRGKKEALLSDVNLAAKTSQDWITYLSHDNLWHRQTAVRLLAEQPDASLTPMLVSMVDPQSAQGDNPDHPALEALWVLHQTGQLDEALALKTLRHPGPMVRAWTIRLMGDAKALSQPFQDAVVELAATEEHPEVRSQILSTARRLTQGPALTLVKAVLARDLDAADPFIPLMAWYTLESHCRKGASDIIALWENDPSLWSKQIVREHITPRLMRRLAASGTRQELVHCAKLIALAPSDEDKAALMTGFEAAFQGRSLPALPDELATALAGLGKGSLLLRVRRGDQEGMAEALTLLGNAEAPIEERVSIARVFGEVAHPPAAPLLLSLALGTPEATEIPVPLRRVSFSSLASYDLKETGEQVSAQYAKLPQELQDAALNLLASRPAWSLALLDAIEAKKIPAEVLTADFKARLALHQHEQLAARLGSGSEQSPNMARVDYQPRIDQVREILAAGAGDPYKGEAVYNQRCSACHKLFHKGGMVGPDLTNYQRDDLGTMLVSIIDPNAEIREGYVNHFVQTKDGRSLAGFMADQDANVIVLRGFDGNDITLQRDEIAQIDGAGMSLMPAGLIEGLSDQELRDFFAYLRISQPISK